MITETLTHSTPAGTRHPEGSTSADGSPGIVERHFHEGNMEALKVIMQRHQRDIFQLGLRLFFNREKAADFCQEVFIRAYEKRKKYNPALPVKPWLFTLATNFGRDELRRKKEIIMADGNLPDHPAPEQTESHVQKRELQHKIGSVMSKLGMTYREIIALRFSSDLSLNEIAEVLGISLSAAKVRLCRGIRAFEEQFKADGGEEYVM